MLLKAMEKVRNMTEGCVVVLHRSVDGTDAVDAQDAGAPPRPAPDAREAVAAFRGQHHLHLFVSEAQAASLA